MQGTVALLVKNFVKSSTGPGFNKEFLRIFSEGMIPPVTDVTGEVIIHKHRIAGIGEVHFKTKGLGCITRFCGAASGREGEQEQGHQAS